MTQPAPLPNIQEQVLQKKVIIPLLLAVVLFVLLLVRGDLDLGEVWHRLLGLKLSWYLLGFGIFICGLPLRALRWRIVLREAKVVSLPYAPWASLRNLLEILWISWFANGVLPARLGDVYRCYLFQSDSEVPFSTSLGTVFAERIADLLVLFFMLFLFGALALGFRIPEELQGAFLVSLVLGVLLALMIVAMGLSKRLAQWLVPARFWSKIESFRAGTLAAFRARSFPWVLATTMIIWFIEGARLFCVVQAFGDLSLPISVVVFISLLGSLLTSIPALPGGIGLTEAGISGALMFFMVPKNEAFSIAMLDRVLNFWLVIFVGLILYLRRMGRAELIQGR
jgi:glycosyltransferase 2 family protein